MKLAFEWMYSIILFRKQINIVLSLSEFFASNIRRSVDTMVLANIVFNPIYRSILNKSEQIKY